jgi:uncharacterized membrane protein
VVTPTLINQATKHKRIRTIDTGRGVAMLFVFLSHFTEYFLTRHGKVSQLEEIWKITRVASPMFMLISGITLGYLYYTNRQNYKPARKKIIDRGLFLISIAHILILFSWIPMISYFHGSWMVIFITDTIGICLIVGSLLVSRVRMEYRIALSAILFSLSWIMIGMPGSSKYEINLIIEILFGKMQAKQLFDNFPLVPWFSLYLFGTAIGEKVGKYHHSGDHKAITRMLFRMGAITVFISICLTTYLKLVMMLVRVEHFLDPESIMGSPLPILLNYLKNPPSLVYFLYYGGIGFIMLAFINLIIEKKFITPLVNILEIVGRTSLFAFILQYFVFFSLVVIIDPPYSRFWPLYFLALASFMIIVIRLWYNKGLNRYITLLNLPFWRIFVSNQHETAK